MPKIYLQNIFNTAKAGGTREESYYPDLKNFLEDYSKKVKKKFLITPLPKKTEAGNPDFRILTAKKELVGYIEAKSPEIEDLDEIEDSEQLQRYRQTFPNLILTNFFEFRRYRNGELIEKVQIGRPFVAYQLKQIPPVENEKEFFKLLDQFFSFRTQRTTTAKALATELAKRTRFLRDNVIIEELKEEKIEGTQTLEGFYKAFKGHLISSLSIEDFADLFSQTITYGLFAARARADKKFHRELAYKYIPHTIGILRDVFKFVSSAEIPKPMEWIVDDISEVLSATDVKTIISNFYKEGRGKDPIIHFYETFLAEYDPKEREKKGVYYTPEPVVKYIVSSIHELLKTKFGKKDGFADSSVTVLDPAAGTLTFPAQAIGLAIQEYSKKYGGGGVKALIKDHVLKDFYAFELMMAPYAVGHLKIGFVLDEFNYKLSEDERFNLFLTNTLDFTKEDPNRFPGVFEQSIAKESSDALKIKEDVPVMVITGNPPYSGSSENKGEWILDKIKEYKQIRGKSLGERNPKWIQDDYVKFFRFAQWKIEKNSKGIIGFITNHAWLDNPTFRGMRYSLLNTFDEIYVLNLHGSTLKKEKTPEDGKDENVFDIQPGVAITICIKTGKKINKKKIYYADLWGLREEKYNWLSENNIKSTGWQEVIPRDNFYFFMPKKEKGLKLYNNFFKITDIFSLNSVGVVTGRDKFVTDKDRNALEARIRDFIESDSIELIKNNYQLKDKPASRWHIKTAQQELRKDENWEDHFTKISYRPFDERWIFYHPSLVERSRENIMRNMFKNNLAIVCCRQYSGDHFNHAFISDQLVESCYVSNKTKEIGYVFPLFAHGEKDSQGNLFEGSRDDVSKQNFKKEFVDFIYKDDLSQLTPEDIFNYIYAILYSNVYRQKYHEFLKIDFPRFPFTKNYKLFSKLSELGSSLISLHLLKALPAGNRNLTQFQGEGDTEVNKVEWKNNEIWINNDQKFTPVPKEVWEYHIGGYQVLLKWLKDRKGDVLSAEEIKKYCNICTVLKSTIEIQKEIDKFYPQAEKSLINS